MKLKTLVLAALLLPAVAGAQGLLPSTGERDLLEQRRRYQEREQERINWETQQRLDQLERERRRDRDAQYWRELERDAWRRIERNRSEALK